MEHSKLQAKYAELHERWKEQEQALLEMGTRFSQSELKVSTFEQRRKVHSSRSWVSDKNVRACQECERGFSVTRRKHHCRKCGGVFCHECSDNRVLLPSSSKPVRVCDACSYEQLRHVTT